MVSVNSTHLWNGVPNSIISVRHLEGLKYLRLSFWHMVRVEKYLVLFIIIYLLFFSPASCPKLLPHASYFPHSPCPWWPMPAHTVPWVSEFQKFSKLTPPPMPAPHTHTLTFTPTQFGMLLFTLQISALLNLLLWRSPVSTRKNCPLLFLYCFVPWIYYISMISR